MTDDKIRALLDGATPGPWRSSETWRPPIGFGDHETNADGNVFWGYSVSGSSKHGGHILPTLAAVHNFPDNIHANARLIASAPSLAAEVLRLREALRACLEWMDKAHPAGTFAPGFNQIYDDASAALKGAAE